MKITITKVAWAAGVWLLTAGLAAAQPARIDFNSITPKARFELARRTYDPTPTPVWGTLSLPAGAMGPVPAMVIAHGSAGVQKKDSERWVPFFNQLGIAAFLVDSYAPRHIERTMDDQSLLDQSANDADALFALRLLADDPRIDRKRIGVIGFSRGGVVALDTAVEAIRKGLVPDDIRFAAHIAFYPGCQVRFWSTPSPLTGAPIMMALAGKDDYTPPQACIDYGNVMKAAGLDVEVHVYEGAYHDFDNTVAYFKMLPNAQTRRNCPPGEIDPNTWVYRLLETGETFKRFQDFAAAANFPKCLSTGVAVGNDFGSAKKAEQDVRRFLSRVFGL